MTRAGSGRTSRQASSSESGPHRAASDRRGAETAGTVGGSATGGPLEPQDGVGPGDDGVVVGGHDDGGPGARGPRRGSHDGGPGQPVLADRRLVGEHHRRLVHHGGRHGQPPLLAAGQLPRVGVSRGGPGRGGRAAGRPGPTRSPRRDRRPAKSRAPRRGPSGARWCWPPAAAPRRRPARGRPTTAGAGPLAVAARTRPASTRPRWASHQPGEGISSVDLPDPLGPTRASADPPGTARSTVLDGGRRAGRAVSGCGGTPHGERARARYRTVGAGEQRSETRPARIRGLRVRPDRAPRCPCAASASPRSARTVAGGPSATTSPLGVEDDEPVDEVEPGPEPVLDDDRGQPARPDDLGDHPAYRRRVGRVEHRRGLVEQEHPRDMASAPASASRCCSPPDRVSGVSPARSARPTSASAAATARPWPRAAYRGSRGRRPRRGRPWRRRRRRPGPAGPARPTRPPLPAPPRR